MNCLRCGYEHGTHRPETDEETKQTMTRTTYFVASTDPETPVYYDQADYVRDRALDIPNGIYDGVGNNLVVAAKTPASMKVTVGTGVIVVNGYKCECSALETLAITAAHATLPRIDRIVARLDTSTTPGISFAVLTGTASSSPVVPTLTQTAYIYEIALAQVAVGAGVTSIVTGNIISERVYQDRTNLFHRDVVMQGDLDVTGDVGITGALDVTGEVTFGGSVAFGGGVVADLTGDISGYIKRKITYSASSDDVVLIKGDMDVSLDRYIATTPIHHSLILPSGGSTNAGSIVIGTIGIYNGPSDIDHGTCTITCYDGSGTVVYTHTITSESYINVEGGYWTDYTATIPQNTARIIITGNTHWRWGDVYVIPSII